MSNNPYGSGIPKSFVAYPSGEFDLESGTIRKTRKHRKSKPNPIKMIRSVGNRLKYYCKLHPCLVFMITLLVGVTILVLLPLYENRFQMSSYQKYGMDFDSYPLPNLKNLVMVAGHSVYTSSSCGKVDKEDSWFLESYQKNPGQASTFLAHIQEGIETASKDNAALLLFSGGETRRDAGPRSEAQSYWAVAESKGWFGELLAMSFALNIFLVFSVSNMIYNKLGTSLIDDGMSNDYRMLFSNMCHCL